MPAKALPSDSLRDRQKAHTRALIVDALLDALAAGKLDQVTHEELARRVGIARQTVYRHFPDRESLLAALWERVNAALSKQRLPSDEASLHAELGALYANCDRNAPLITIAQSTPQGRAMRMSVRERRAKAFRAAAAGATRHLPPDDATQAVAVLQLLHGGQAWIEMRQQWGLRGEEIARACTWAIRTLLADLHARKGRPLDEMSSAQPKRASKRKK